jgi:hypothetical protein
MADFDSLDPRSRTRQHVTPRDTRDAPGGLAPARSPSVSPRYATFSANACVRTVNIADFRRPGSARGGWG